MTQWGMNFIAPFTHCLIAPLLSSPPRVHLQVRVFAEDAQGNVGAAIADGAAFFGAAVGAALPHGADQVRHRLV